MPAKKITIKTVQSLQQGETIWDSETKGFGCRCQKQSKTFILKYRDGKGRSARQYLYTIGKLGSPWTPDAARDEAKRLLGCIVNGENPSEDRNKIKESCNVEQAFDLFMKSGEGKKKPRTQAEYQRMYDRFIKKPLGKVRAIDVTQRDIEILHDKHASIPTQANRLLQLLKALFNWCEDKGVRPNYTNPCRGIDKYKEKPCERRLSEEELFKLGEALKQYEQDNRYIKTTRKVKPTEEPALKTVTTYVTAAIRLLILTGARRNEILTLKWSDVDFECNLIRLQESKTGQKTIYLSAPALQVLGEIPRIKGNPYVICGKKEGAHLVNIKDPWMEIRENAGLEGVRIHDIRHNYASTAIITGHHLKVVGALLSHQSSKTTERYMHLSNDPVQSANEAISTRIQATMTTKPTKDNVVKIHQ